ncbi:hypothetical protein WMY93_028933 [Mugilogobius chulae]|uniref:Uncharacterized protein n=1 Tax=Mugilogobius chulae TaxID=88201 RepID=A0AAW0N0R9_9GOBI
MRFTPAPKHHGARSKDSRSPPPSLGSLTDFPLMRSSTPPAPTAPTGGSAGVLPHTSCVIARRGARRARSLRAIEEATLHRRVVLRRRGKTQLTSLRPLLPQRPGQAPPC